MNNLLQGRVGSQEITTSSHSGKSFKRNSTTVIQPFLNTLVSFFVKYEEEDLSTNATNSLREEKHLRHKKLKKRLSVGGDERRRVLPSPELCRDLEIVKYEDLKLLPQEERCTLLKIH